MTTSTKRIALIIAGALLSGAALMAQGAASPSAKTATKVVPPAKVQAQGKTAKTARARRSHTAKKASHRQHRRARKAAAVKPAAK